MSVSSRWTSPRLWICLGCLLYAVVMFRVVLPSDTTIFSQDYNAGLMAFYKSELPGSMTHGFWRSFPLLGRVGHMPPTLLNLLLSILPMETFMDWIYAICLLGSTACLSGFLRLKGLGRAGALAGGLTAFWLGSNLTLIQPGHLQKYAVLFFASATLYALERCLRDRSIRWSLLSGGFLGMMFMHQADVALFFGLLLGAYFLLGLLTQTDRSFRTLARCALPLWIPALMLVGESYQHSMQTQVNNVAVLQEGSDTERWNFITQWSFPPAESGNLLLPGYYGWYSGHPEAPYHGIMGQSAGYAGSGGGLPNFRLEEVYLGILPIGFALLSLIGLGDRHTRRERLFWGLACLITFLLACGKFTPLYTLFSQLPLVRHIRNPNKFLQVFQVALGVLTAYGVDHWVKGSLSLRTKRIAAGGFLAVAVAALVLSAIPNPDVFTDTPWQSAAGNLVKRKQLAAIHLLLLAASGAGLILFARKPGFLQAAGWGLVVLIAVDSLVLGRTFIRSEDLTFLKQNRLTEHLHRERGLGRVAILDPSGTYGIYLTHLFPANQVPFANISVAPRLDQDMQHYLKQRLPDPSGVLDQSGIHRLPLLQGGWLMLINNPSFRQIMPIPRITAAQLGYWRDFGVTLICTPRTVWDALQGVPDFASRLEETYSYNLVRLPNGNLAVMSAPNGQHVVLRLKQAPGRFQLVHQETRAPVAGRLSTAVSNPTGFRLRVEVPEDNTLLRLADRYDPALRARINEGPAQPLKVVNGIFAGLPLPKGVHRIELNFAKQAGLHQLQWAGVVLTLALLVIPPVIRLGRYVFTDQTPRDGQAADPV